MRGPCAEQPFFIPAAQLLISVKDVLQVESGVAGNEERHGFVAMKQLLNAVVTDGGMAVRFIVPTANALQSLQNITL
jgi:hypothetical protein